MKVPLAIAMIFLACAIGYGQPGQSQNTAPPPASSAPPGMQQKGPGPGPRAREMMREHMREMQADLRDMQVRLEKLRADANKVHDLNTRTALLDVAEMWQKAINRMQSNLQNMRTMMRGGGMRSRGTMPSQ
jgi:TolA-binding protein